ncbi:MAG: CDGSH iron-sulfur domain-containing protein [Clostridiales Family XIII bacterium]|jgi:CDGSH-type Zn-finger protein|nr:CDGSH iron-sulfur domain-containing protein [Clostridiales Family XIII bacterium]
MAQTRKKIQVLVDGPYIVTGGVPLFDETIVPDEDGNGLDYKKTKDYEIADGQQYALCRCGQSENKPFCDGTHAKVGFDGKETANMDCYADSVKIYPRRDGKEDLQLMDRKDLCAVARFCDRFENCWHLVLNCTEDTPEKEEEAIYQAQRCPSGRITVRRNGVELEPELDREITLLEDVFQGFNGPIYVKGGITVVSEDGTEYEIRNRRTLCRCGQSKNMPFCDSSHLGAKNMKIAK